MVVGLLMTLYTGFNYVTREKVIGIGVMVIGGFVFLYGKKRKGKREKIPG